MKWFSHETSAHTNLKLQMLIQKFGIAAYGYYWFLIELVGKEGEKFRVSAKKDWKKFSQMFAKISEKEQTDWLNFMAELNLIDKKALDEGALYIPKLAERADDYTKRVRRVSEHPSDNVLLQYSTIQDNTEQPFNSKAYIQKFVGSDKKLVHIIGLYLQHKGFELPSADAFKPEINQAWRVAKSLTDFTDEQIKQTMVYLDSKKLDYVWKLSTVAKMITSVINDRK